MIEKLREITDEKLGISCEKTKKMIAKELLCDKIEKMCYREIQDTETQKELSIIMGWIIAVVAINLKNNVIELYFSNQSFWSKRPEIKITKQEQLYQLLKRI